MISRVALGLMKLHKDQLLECQTANGFLDALQTCAANLKDPEELMKVEISLNFHDGVESFFNENEVESCGTIQ